MLAVDVAPGPNMIYLVSRSIAQGRVAGIVSLAGTGVGFLVYMTMVNLGLGVVFVVVPWLYIGLKAAGVLYLAWLACKTLRPGGAGLFATIAGFLAIRPSWTRRQRRITGSLLGAVAILLAREVPQTARP